MTMKLPQKAGFVATTAEWDALVRIAENLAAQAVKLRSDLYLARDEYSAADDDAHKWAAIANEKANALDAARAEVARLTDSVNDLGDAIGEALIYASGKTEQILRRALGDDDATLRQPAPAGGEARE